LESILNNIGLGMLSLLYQRRTWNTALNLNVYEDNNQIMAEF